MGTQIKSWNKKFISWFLMEFLKPLIPPIFFKAYDFINLRLGFTTDSSESEWKKIWLKLDDVPKSDVSPFEHPNWIKWTKIKLQQSPAKNKAILNPGVRSIAECISLILHERKSIKILDFGGGSGEIAPDYLSQVADSQMQSLEYTILDSGKAATDLGKEFFKNSKYPIKFVNEMQAPLPHFDLILSASVFQYVLDWRVGVEWLISFHADIVAFSRLIVTQNDVESYFSLQPIITRFGNCGSTSVVIINRNELVKLMQANGYSLLLDGFDNDLPHHFAKTVPEEYRRICERTLIFGRKQN